MKQTISLLLAFVMLLSLAVTAFADEETLIGETQIATDAVNAPATSGTCGEELFWELSEDGVLTIYGQGKMADYAYNGTPWYADRLNILSVVVESGVESIAPWAFIFCENLEKVTLADTVVRIGMGAFRKCTALKTANLPAGLTVIENNLFSGCSSLEAISLPEDITGLEESAFNGCSSLKTITIPSGVTHLDKWAISGCMNLTEVVFTGSAPTIAEDALTWFSGTAYYPAEDPTWTSAVLQNYGGNITWLPYGDTDSQENVAVYRFYNPYTNEHLLVSDEGEKNGLVKAGWTLEGVAWNAPKEGSPVYRLYNPDDWHTYTSSEEEMRAMVAAGWSLDGPVSCTADSKNGRPVYRLFNPYEKTNFHLFTAGVEERDMLVGVGWILEGIAWYAVK